MDVIQRHQKWLKPGRSRVSSSEGMAQLSQHAKFTHPGRGDSFQVNLWKKPGIVLNVHIGRGTDIGQTVL